MLGAKRLLSALVFTLVYVPALTADENKIHVPPVREINGLQLIELEGAPYAIGYGHGSALAPSVEAMAERVLGYFRSSFRMPFLKSFLTREQPTDVWRRAEPFIPEAYLEELRGLSDGSGVALSELYALHALPYRTFSGAGFAAWNQATVGGRLIHMRNLDWSREAGIHEFATVFVIRPSGGLAYVNIGWAGFIGSLSGINEKRIAVGQAGAESTDASHAGQPMVFILRDVLRQAHDLEQAAELVQRAPRTEGFNYLFSDAYAGKGIVIETTRSHVKVFEDNDAAEREIGYARPLQNVVFRAATAVDPTIRNLQTASGGEPERPGLEPPSGADYEQRYLGQEKEIRRRYGRIDAEAAIAIAREIVSESNIQSVIYAWPEVWIANADAETPAAQTEYRRLDVEKLLRRW